MVSLQLVLVLCACVQSLATIIDGSVMLYDGLPNPNSRLCNGPMIELVTTPNATSQLFEITTVLSKTRTYCLQVAWTAGGVLSMTQINGFMNRIAGGSSNGGGIQLAMPVKTNPASHVLSGSQVGVIYPGCLGVGTQETNQHVFTYLPTMSTDTLEGQGISFKVQC